MMSVCFSLQFSMPPAQQKKVTLEGRSVTVRLQRQALDHVSYDDKVVRMSK